jgi:hypothetical protein
MNVNVWDVTSDIQDLIHIHSERPVDLTRLADRSTISLRPRTRPDPPTPISPTMAERTSRPASVQVCA